MWLLQDNPPPGFMTIDNFMNDKLTAKIEDIFADINGYIFEPEKVDLNHICICAKCIKLSKYNLCICSKEIII